MRKPHCTVGYTGCKKNGHIPGGPLWTVTWLPKGYAVTLEDRLICTFFDTEHTWDEFGPKNPPPLIKVVCKAIEDHLCNHPDDTAGHLVNAHAAVSEWRDRRS